MFLSQINQKIYMSNFQLLKIVDRGSETQPHVVENLNTRMWQDKGQYVLTFNPFNSDFIVAMFISHKPQITVATLHWG